MSAPSANAPNDGIVAQIGTSLNNAVKYVSETIQGNAAEASKEGNKEQMKGNVPGKDSFTDRISGGLDAASDSLKEGEHKGAAKANKQGI